MRTVTVWRAITTLLLLSGIFGTPLLSEQGTHTAVLALGNAGEGEEDGGEDGDRNRGHGNDSDGVDEDNPGRGNGPNRGENEEDSEDEDEQSTDRDTDTVTSNAGAPVTEAVAYLVEVTCMPGEDPGTTSCTFNAIAPDGVTDASAIAIPEDDVCAEVADGIFERADPDPATGITGYTSTGDAASLTLILDGEVTTAGTATYWLVTGDGVFPSTGPGLRCEAPAAGTATQEPSGKSGVTDSTGELLVQTFVCTDVPADTETFDWYGECGQADDTHRFTLNESGDPDDQNTEETDASGEATFESLAPGTYHLEITDTSWCHAESDRVTSEGEVVIEAGQRTTVWGFICEGAGGV